MCGRFTLHIPPELIAEIFGTPLPVDYRPRFNVAPSQIHPVVRWGNDGREIAPMRWGLIPSWAQDQRLGFSMINARAETAAMKPAFRGSLHARRCLVLSDGFFEWRHEGKEKEPFYITLKGGGVMPYAGLWDQWRAPEGEILETYTVITCASNELVQKLHDRMPVILERKDYDTWLNPAFPPERAMELLRPYPAGKMTLWKVGKLVNNPRNDSEECIRKL
jgi:putative SOS response-associated peptidase YedK